MNTKSFIFAIIVLIVIAYGFFTIPHKSDKISQVKIGGVSVKVELALTPATQEQGLSGRAGLDDNAGMLFVFPHSDKYYFWMKDMRFVIDMIWISEDMKVVYIKKDARPESYPETFGPDTDAKYVLEVSSGFSDKNNLQVGDEVKFLSSNF